MIFIFFFSLDLPASIRTNSRLIIGPHWRGTSVKSFVMPVSASATETSFNLSSTRLIKLYLAIVYIKSEFFISSYLMANPIKKRK